MRLCCFSVPSADLTRLLNYPCSFPHTASRGSPESVTRTASPETAPLLPPPPTPNRSQDTGDFLMAFVFRRWKVLLALNALAVAGFMTFWARCNTRSIQSAGAETPADWKRPRGNGTAQGLGISHEVLLKRLGSLEDVVYRQLNGKDTGIFILK